MAYAAGVACLLAAVALSLDKLCERVGFPRRFAWLAGLTLALLDDEASTFDPARQLISGLNPGFNLTRRPQPTLDLTRRPQPTFDLTRRRQMS